MFKYWQFFDFLKKYCNQKFLVYSKDVSKIFLKVLLFSFSISLANAENINVFNFTENEIQSLEVRKVRGADNKTEYLLGSNENGNYLKAVADNAASEQKKKVTMNKK